MRKLIEVFKNYKDDIIYIENFIAERFGIDDILLRKNKGLIVNSNFDVKSSRIKGYAFHGYGCEFRFKEYTLDIEFMQDGTIGFTDWSFFLFSKRFIPEIKESEVKDFFSELEINRVLELRENVFCLRDN